MNSPFPPPLSTQSNLNTSRGALSIEVRGGRRSFAPGETLQGIMRWNLSHGAPALELRLFWFTSGKGTTNLSVEATQRVDNPDPMGSRDFSFLLPVGPHSFSGTLISLTWALELVTVPGDEVTKIEFVLSPTGREIILPPGVSPIGKPLPRVTS